MSVEMKEFAKSWWCHGGGAATLILMGVVSLFRAPRDLIFWAAAAFFVGHTAMAVRRYLIERAARTTATVIRHHRTHTAASPRGGMIFTPRPANSILVPLKINGKTLSQQTKNHL